MNTRFKHRWTRSMSGIGFAALTMVGCASIPAPTEQLAVSKMAVSTASRAGGNEYAMAEMRSAQDKLDRATQAMTAEEYAQALSLAEQAQVDAKLAETKALSAKAQLAATSVQEGSSVLRKEIDRRSQE